MPRKKNPENAGLPARWNHRHGAYYYQVPAGLEEHWNGKRWFRLGKTLTEAYATWAERMPTMDVANTIGELLDRYAREVVPTKAVATREGNVLAIARLKPVFGRMPLASLKPKHVYKYVDTRRKKTRDEQGRMRGGLTVAHREVEVLSHAFTKAVEWGYIDAHPFAWEIRLEGTKPRKRYVNDSEYEGMQAIESKRKKGSVLMIQAYLNLKNLTGMAQGDLLRLTSANMKPEGILITRHKTEESSGKSTLYEWTPELREAVERCKAVRPALSPFLFCNRRGEGYIDEATGKAHGWKSMWQRFRQRAYAEGKVTDRFTEHDMRAKVGSDADSDEHARALLSHTSTATTQIYRRKPEKVKPLSRKRGE